MADVGAQVYDYFRSRGYAPAAAAGIIGNFRQESSLRPNAPRGGLDQGQGSRYHPGNLRQQLDGIYSELQGSERHTAEALRGVKGPREAARIFSEKFERPGIPMLSNRERYAQEALQRYGAREVAHASAAATIASELAPHLEAGPNANQSADLVSLLQQTLGAQQRPASAPATPLRRPQSAGGEEPAPGTPRVPQAAQEAPQQNSPAAILSVLSKLAADASPEGSGEQAALGTSAPTAGTPADSLTSRKGIVDFNGHKVAAWIAPILHYVQAHGVTPQITSGYRSKAEQEQIYNSGVRPAAVPGTSNHEGDAFPRGAVDIGNAAAVAKVLANSPYKGLLVYAGAKDPVHFSHPHGGGY
jgi:hypothetical protein